MVVHRSEIPVLQQEGEWQRQENSWEPLVWLAWHHLSCLEWSICAMLLLGLFSLEEMFVSDISVWASRHTLGGFRFSK